MERLLPFLPKQFAERLSERARSSLLRAVDAARGRGSPEVIPLDLFSALGTQRGALASHIIKNYRLQLPTEVPPPPETRPAPALILSLGLAEVLRRATFFAAKSTQSFIGTEHLLLGILDVAQNEPSLTQILPKVTGEKMKKHVQTLIASAGKLLEIIGLSSPGSASSTAKQKDAPALEAFGQNLIEAARQGRLDPVIGRDQELDRLTAILIRRTKNNPLLVGDPGVGKTAIVMGLAERIAQGKVPPELFGRPLYLVDLGMLVAGTVYRGEFEARLKEMLREAKEAAAILFIDEFHTVIGAGSAPGSLDAANLLKPALASGEIQCIGATTYVEFRRYIERDQALERRLQPVFVQEPTLEATLAILEGLRARLETHHRIRIPTKTLEASVRLAPFYLPDRFFPDKAIDLLDEAASRVRVRQLHFAPELTRLQKIRERVAFLEEKKATAIAERHYDEATAIQTLQDNLVEEVKLLAHDAERPQPTPLFTLTQQNIQELVAEASGLPITELAREIAADVRPITAVLKKNIVGQDDVIRAVTAALRRPRGERGFNTRPRASFLFLGPKGVGKTASAKALAEALFGSDRGRERQCLKLDMAEYSEPHTVARLIGAPPGYVGYEEGGLLAERVRKNPACLILFDEIERAHPKVAELLLHILEDGQLTDSQGRRVRFQESVIVLTSNLETSRLKQAGALGFTGAGPVSARRLESEQLQERVLKELRLRFRPELVDRIDRVLVFKNLQKRDIAQIMTLELQRRLRSLRETGLRVFVPPPVRAWLTEKTFKPDEGARAVRRIIETLFEEPLAQYMENQTGKLPTALQALLEKNRVVFRPFKKSRP